MFFVEFILFKEGEYNALIFGREGSLREEMLSQFFSTGNDAQHLQR